MLLSLSLRTKQFRGKSASPQTVSQIRQHLGVLLNYSERAHHGEDVSMISKVLPALFALSLSAQAALAANCTSYPLPYTLTNGQTADATQVMANFNDVINCVNALSAVTGPASSVAGHLATFADTSGKVLQDGGPFSVSAQYLANSAVTLGGTMLNGTIVPSNAANALTFTIQTLAGATPSATDPVYFVFRNASAGTGNYSVISVTSALSVTVPTSSTLGFSNNTPGRIWLTAINNAGTVELAVINCLTSAATSKSIYPLAGWGIVNTTALGGPSNGTGVFYSTIARSSVPYGVLGYASYETGLATAGTWNANPTRMELYRAGVPLPGAVVQMVYGTNTGATTATSSTKVATNTAQSITVTSAANLIRVRANGVLTPPDNPCTGQCDTYANAQLGRNASTSLFANLQIIHNNNFGSNTRTNQSTPTSFEGLDAPGTACAPSCTYTVYIWSSGSTSQWLGTYNSVVSQSSMVLEEIMD
jgi:hypothetical protein